MTHPGMARPIVIKMDANLGQDILQSNKRTLGTIGITDTQFEELVEQVCGKKKKSGRPRT